MYRMTNLERDLPIVGFASGQEWEAWLLAEHAQSNGVWLKIAKQGRGIAGVSKAEAVAGAICFGWIDGQVDKFDDNYWLTRFTPRRALSKWSQINRDLAASLMESGRMRPAGLAEVERARADGRWEAAYPASSTATVPDDLQAALDFAPDAKRAFERLDRTNRYAILYRIHDAKRPETRAARILKFVEMLTRGETLHPVKKKEP